MASYSFSSIILFRIIISVMSLITVSPCCHNIINNIRAHLAAGVQTIWNFKLSPIKYCCCFTLCTRKFENTTVWQSQLLNNEGWMWLLHLARSVWKNVSRSNSQCAGPRHTSQRGGAFAGLGRGVGEAELLSAAGCSTVWCLRCSDMMWADRWHHG